MSDHRAWIVVLMAVNGLGLWMLEQVRPHSGPAHDRAPRAGANLALTAVLLASNLVLDRIAVAAGAHPWQAGRGPLRAAGLTGWAAVVATVVALDALAYAAHRLMHALPAAWRFHRVHHSDAHVDVTTAFRQHPLETVWRHAFQLGGALAIGASPRSVSVYLALSVFAAQVEHADVSLPWDLDAALRAVLATPAMHRVHHSRLQAETDTNYSNIFSVWDRLFGTYRPPRRHDAIAFGLDDAPARPRATALLALPFRG